MKVPAFMLKKLYVAKSLANGPEGASFRLKNTMASATLTRAPAITIDGSRVDDKTLLFREGADQKTAADITPQTPIEFKKGVEVLVVMQGRAVAAGKHTIKIEAESREWQTLAFDVEDTV